MRIKALFLWLSLFSIAMAFMESAVVVYIRELLYPGGFAFPLAELNGSLALTEIIREAATIIMLAGAGVIAGKTFSQRFAWFIYCFAVWDIFYYVFLKLLINWPDSFLEWDVLFLIPVTWTGPVISPLIVCVLMIALSVIIIRFAERGVITRFSSGEWLLMIAGAMILIISFIWDYSAYILRNYSFRDLWNLPDRQSFFDLATQYIPEAFNWLLFSLGLLTVLSSIILYYRRLERLCLEQ